MVGLINKASLVGAIVAAANAVVSLHLDHINTVEGAAAAAVCIALAAMTGYGGAPKSIADDIKDFVAMVAGKDGS